MQISKKFKLALVLSLALFAHTAQAVLTDRCIIVISQSATALTEADAYRNGLSPAEVDADIQATFMDAEIEAMRQIYDLGGEVYNRHGTRTQALNYINEGVNQQNLNSDLPANLKTKSAKAAVDAFMCGYDDMAKSK